MVVYDIRCSHDHVFEAWFPDSSQFEVQAKSGQVVCPTCGDARVVRAPMAPNISTGRGEAEQRRAMHEHALKVLTNMRSFVEKNCDNVGGHFAEEARKIHYGESAPRNIYGRATGEEAEQLKDEGIEFGELPWPNREDA
jgi:hypothetical protein